MTKVYLAEGWTPYEGSEIYGVYSTPEKAEQAIKDIPKNERYHENYEVIEMEVDNPN